MFLQDLPKDHLKEIRESLNPYSKIAIPKSLSSALSKLGSLKMKVLYASRIPLGQHFRTFDPSPFLCASSLLAFRDLLT